MKFIVYQDASSRWRWRLRSPNGRIIADSAEGYTRERDARRAVLGVQRGLARC